MNIYSATQFYNELDILEIRLETLDPIVDYHIITESNLSHSGIPKPFYYEENKERFKKFWPKIIYQKLDNLPTDFVNLSPNSAKTELEKLCIEKVIAGNWWPHEHLGYGRDTYEKESVLMCMENCKPDDIIISSDLDEIPNPKAVEFVLMNFNPDIIYNLKLRTFFYYLNMEKEDWWVGATIQDFEHFKKNSVCELRMHRRGMFIEKAGWHFSYQGGLDKVKEKIEAINEYELNNPVVKDNLKNNIENCLTNDRDLYFRPTKFWVTPIDETFPIFLQENQEKFSHMIYEYKK
jgi:beta-1,4-mannosyl-glycoprotein beta-1,4-N-acetylglucosaminyltransferase